MPIATKEYDVAILGGGPAGATVATFLRKYAPDLDVIVIEKEKFPRDHVGESQLPSISPILDEMGVWDTVEAAGFPVKIGASYTWGRDLERWDFDFYPVEQWQDEPRPARFEGQRRYTAFQVDRARYDEILLRHAQSLGAEVRENTKVARILNEGDRVTGFELADDEVISARHYVDASGVSGFLRRTLGIENWAPKELRNIAIWDYWQNAEWAVEIGSGATRVQVRSLPYGWVWFIPLGPTRTSIGLICPSEYYKNSGETPEALYRRALADQTEIAALLTGATSEGPIQTTKDWSHLTDRLAGENWFICGEAAGFADPILAAGLSLAHSSAREVAYTILELERGEIDKEWLRSRFDEKNRTNISQHIRFAQYWYAANGCFTDLQDHCRSIAREAGLSLTPKQAWQWLSQGGFTTEQLGLATFGSFDIASAKQILQRFDADSRSPGMKIDGYNEFRLNLQQAKQDKIGQLKDGRIELVTCYRKGKRTLPITGYYQTVMQLLKQTKDAETILAALKSKIAMEVPPANQALTFSSCIQALEAMVQQGWVKCGRNRKKPVIRLELGDTRHIRSSKQGQAALEKAGRADIVKSRI